MKVKVAYSRRRKGSDGRKLMIVYIVEINAKKNNSHMKPIISSTSKCT